ncbi:MAG TPA: V-type ATP synthase subunit A, partial [Kiritimatiellae bacterium]|nr:V-type ATP synthase subunit A [Kiritimatiellia bacterium]
GSVTIGGTVSPAGGNFDEPVTQSTLKVVGAFHGLSRERAEARRYPAIHPLESWSKYAGVADAEQVDYARKLLRRGNEIYQMMKVVGEEGTSVEDFVTYLKAEYLDAVYLQQDAYDEVDGATSAERQKYVFDRMVRILKAPMSFKTRDEARRFFQDLVQVTRDWNRTAMDADEFQQIEEKIEKAVAGVTRYV